MSVALDTAEIVEEMRRRTTEELIEIWTDHRTWSETAIDAARHVLRERNVNLAQIREEIERQRQLRAQRTNILIRERSHTATGAYDTELRVRGFARRMLAALKSVKLSPSLRLSFTIATGVFLGLLAMRIASAIYQYAEEQDLLPALIVIAVVGFFTCAVFLIARRMRKAGASKEAGRP